MKIHKDYLPPVSTLAIVSALFAVLTPLAFFNPIYALPALVAIPAGIFAIIEHRRYGHLGIRWAKLGVIVSIICGLIGPIINYHWKEYRYASEAPMGYIRLDFSQLSDENDGLSRYLGQKVCLKGYENFPGSTKDYPTSTIRFSHNGSRSNDEKTILVDLQSGVVENYLYKPIAVSGILELNPEYDGSENTYRYKIVDAEIRWVQTDRQLGSRSGEGFCLRSSFPTFNRNNVVDRKRSDFV